MSKNIKLFLVCFILSIFFWSGVNILEKGLEDFFYVRELEKKPSVLTADISYFTLLNIGEPVRIQEIPDLKILARSAISVFIDSQEKDLILFEKNKSEKFPIASLTKLMTALVASNIYELSDTIEISKQAIEQEGEEIKLKAGQIVPVKELLSMALIESSNDAAYALATPNIQTERLEEKSFVDLMNLEAYHNIGLNPETTYFINPTGLDPKDPSQITNHSTSEDLVKLAKYLIKYKPEILEILSQKENGDFSYTLENTNKLLGKIEGIIGGKTGYTDRARGCLILILEGPRKDTFLINVILGSENRFKEMEQLINWTEQAFRF